MKYLSTIMTAGRIFLSAMLLLCQPMTLLFFAVYVLCASTDILDGYAARKTGSVSRSGALWDSFADIVFIAVMFVIMIPVIGYAPWFWIWAGAIGAVKLAAFITGAAKYGAVPFIHTYLNKIAGAVLFCFPFIYYFAGIGISGWIAGATASIAAAEELAIILSSGRLQRDRKGILIR